MSNFTAETTRNPRKASRKLALVVGALAAAMAAAMPAVALDQQSTDPANDNAANWRMGGPYVHDQAPAPDRAGPYASARSEQPTTVLRPHKEFQDYK